MAEKRILVAGGAGFLGSWLCDNLVAEGADVTCIDNMATGLHRNLEHLTGKKNFHFHEMDVTRYDLSTKFDVIFHLASRASPDEYQEHPVETMLANSTGTYSLLESARKFDSRLIFASSSEVYGSANEIPTAESYWGAVNPIGPRSCYDEGKRFGEAICMAFFRQYGLGVRIARIFNTYGPRMREDGAYGRVASRFIDQALHKIPLTVYGKGDQTRSFCYVTDTIDGILRLSTEDKADGETFNIGNSNEITILSLAHLIGRLIGGEFEIKYAPLPLDDPPRRCPNISKAKRRLGWEPRVELTEGIRKTIEWSRQRMDASK
jgi:UDP-glucuronate decarboxylase